jgi:hypothetical protein
MIVKARGNVRKLLIVIGTLQSLVGSICQGEKCNGKKIYRTEGISGMNRNERQKLRSKTFRGIGTAMASQWGSL